MKQTFSLPVFERLTALADPIRSRALLVLEKHELTVNELRSVLQLPQSTVSRHLKVLSDTGWLASRPEGTSRLYRMTVKLDAADRRLWQVVRDQISGTAAAAQDARRVESVVERRRSTSQKFFSTAAGRWDRLRAELFGTRADITGLLSLLDSEWVVADLGCGTGQVSELIAPFVSSVIAVDDSSAMLAAARKRLASLDNVEVREGSLESAPVEHESVDVVLVFLALHYVVEPEKAIAEAARILRRGGRLLVVDMMPHDREELIHEMGHVWRGFSEDQIAELFEAAGLSGVRYRPLPADAAARGPTLFAAIGRRVSMVIERSIDERDADTAPLALTA
ncbi:MAG TPA: metalloregulator ArsR/SmtB family transcription factor [Gemmatimonadaceae bacterium]|jgi:ArsR family transcriptional regulator